jgi:gamma-glutamyl-gamma-aminobutyrate hydrolase PuuD
MIFFFKKSGLKIISEDSDWTVMFGVDWHLELWHDSRCTAHKLFSGEFCVVE